MNFDQVMQLIGKWGGTLKYFPSDPHARTGIAEEIAEMASDIEQVRWLVQRVPKLHSDWPAMREVRAVFCSKFKPKDGIEVYSQVYVDGIPSEKPAQALLAAPELKRLAGDTSVSAAASLAATVRDLAAAKSLDRAVKRLPAPKVAEIPVVRITPTNAITAEDIARAVRENREKRAKEELEITA